MPVMNTNGFENPHVMHKSSPGELSGMTINNRAVAIIWKAVLYFPILPTCTTLRKLRSAIHSRSAETPISRNIINETGNMYSIVGNRADSIINAVATINLSATGSTNAPNADIWFQRRAKNPSKKSVKHAITYMTNDATVHPARKDAIKRGTAKTRPIDSIFGILYFFKLSSVLLIISTYLFLVVDNDSIAESIFSPGVAVKDFCIRNDDFTRRPISVALCMCDFCVVL
mmetsp:Transcript_7334/g.12347  ORF Transcript_7334/g.12347 Transcript_7334/m.12347 type:complete len:229 (+) Transcript_7334:153-839(+)